MTVQRTLAVALLAAAAWGAFEFPVARASVTAAALWLALLVAWRPVLVYAAVALVTPAMDLTPWSGRVFFNEFDIWLLSAFAGALWSTPLAGGKTLSRVDLLLATFLGITLAASVAIGVAGGSEASEWTTAYDSPLNAFRSARGAAYALLVGLLYWRSNTTANAALGAFAGGGAVGLLWVATSVATERLRFCGLVDLNSEFRVTGPFADMHTGGAYLDAYLVATAPLLVCVWRRATNSAVRATLVVTALGAVYAACVTISRAPVVVLGLQAAALAAIGATCRRGASVASNAGRLLAGALIVGLLVAATQAPALKTRFADAAADLSIRWDHWGRSIATLDDGWRTRLFGVGCGGFARAFRQASPSPSGYSLRNEGGVAFLRLVGSPSIYFDQRVSTQPDQQYTLRLRGRRLTDHGELSATLVEKNLLYSYESVACHGLLGEAPQGEWAESERPLATGAVGASRNRSPLPAARRPVSLSLTASPGAVFDIDRVELTDAGGANLVANPGFERGHDRWWWTADDHLAWHAKNAAVHLLVEQGWLGFLAYALLAARALWRLSRAGLVDPDAAALGCSILGVLLMGTIDSVLDSPRLQMLSLMLTGFAVSIPPPSAPAESV